ncbi:hypothetical protein LCGC14_0442460 [marine sediment metagenome]|uniref:Uncharacterized protein n=1 Tax=marine sediment metagenome TaxID=412755 RepID=A0A0F9V6U4_9ZZZZ
MHVKVLIGPILRGPHIAIRAAIWHSVVDAVAGTLPFIDDWFLFSREAATGQKVVTDPVDDWPLLSDDSRAPSYDQASARQKALAELPTLGILQAIVTAVPDASPKKATVDQRWSVLIDSLRDRFLGQPYLPDGSSWKTETVSTLDVAEIKATIKGRYNREVVRRQTNQDIFDSDISIGGLANTEFDL